LKIEKKEKEMNRQPASSGVNHVEIIHVCGNLQKIRAKSITIITLENNNRLSMSVPLDTLTTIIQAFTQEMSIVVNMYCGYVLAYWQAK
jgi:hypothetical protein